MWFDEKDITKYNYEKIMIDNLHGYVLPHAGTKHTGQIIAHTLRFVPLKDFENILIFYLPSNKNPNIENYYHEYYVPYKSLDLFYPDKNYIGFNILKDKKKSLKRYNKVNTLFILSADFSHFLDFQSAIKLENCSVHSIYFKKFNLECSNVIDDKRTFQKLNKVLPNINYHWVGRSRSDGPNGVGYLSFLLKDNINLDLKKPSGFFVTAYDKNMVPRECLGNTKEYSGLLEKNLVEEVLKKASETSRLTNGLYLDIPVTNYSITYLFEEKENIDFIRGWHSILKDAFYLSDVFLENTHSNGDWINDNDIEWKDGDFSLEPTYQKLLQKANINTSLNEHKLYTNEIIHKNVLNKKKKKIKKIKRSLTKNKKL